MGRPDPCILFAQSFVHTQLDEYVDEVLFAEPVVVTAFEILELNSTPSTSTISITGATSPPSFALEVFVQCEGESRFRRLCPAFLYSHSSSNSLEVEVVVTSHLVIRGSYRSLTLVIYGNTAEDLGQFNIEYDLDSSLANLVSSPLQGKLEDLPPAFSSAYLPLEKSITSFKSLTPPFPVSDLSSEIKEFLKLILKIYQSSFSRDILYEAVRSVVSAVSSYVSCCHFGIAVKWNEKRLRTWDKDKDEQKIIDAIALARKELVGLIKDGQLILADHSTDSLEEEIVQEIKSEFLVDIYNQCFLVCGDASAKSALSLSQDKSTFLQLGMVLLLCSARESCFHMVSSGGLRNIVHMLNDELQRSSATVLMLLSVVEHATRHAIGCEDFLGWWPRTDANVPVGSSDGYSYLLSLLLQNQRPDVASLLTYILHRLRTYEITCKYESAALSLLKHLSSGCYVADQMSTNLLISASHMLKQILKLLEFDCIIEEISPIDSARRSSTGLTEGLLSYKATVDYITSSKYNFTIQDIDTHLLYLLKERGFLPLSAALLSSPILRSGNEATTDVFFEIMASIELIIFSLLECRSGLTFLLLQPEATTTLILSLKGVGDINKEDSLTLKDASVLLSNGFFCRSEEVGIIVELHLRVVLAIDRLLSSSAHSEEQLWVLWELCTISRSECGRQALLVIQHFPEVISVLLECLRSFKDSEQVPLSSASNLVIFHCAAEIFEILVTDSAALSLGSWIDNAMELHKALHSSSPGSNRKDAPTRLLEWIDAGAVYHKKGAAGLLRYAAVLASGGDAHLTSTSVLVSDSMDVEDVVGDSMSSSDSQILDNLLGKLVSDKYFEGVSLCSTSLVQLTTAFRILAFISQDSAVAVSLIEEGAITLLYVVLVNCKCMLERSSNNYDYLVDEGAECKSTSDLLLERSHEQNLVDLLVPGLIFLINLLQKLQDAKEQYRNTKLLNALLKLHREVSPKVALIAADLSVPLPSSSLGWHVVCRLIGSTLACWPIFGWAPGLFHCLLESVQATSTLAMGPKDACSILCLLTDLLPEECMWLWKNGVPALSALRRLSVGSILGSQWEGFVNWYLEPENQIVLLGRLGQQLDKITQIIINFSSTALEVILDMLRVFLVRIACQKVEFATTLLHPLIFYISKKINETSVQEVNAIKVYRLLQFVVSLLEYPKTKVLMLSEGILGVLSTALGRFHEFVLRKPIPDSRSQGKNPISLFSWSIPIFKSLSLIFSNDDCTDNFDELNELKIKNFGDDVSCIARQLLKLCQILPVGRELLACLSNFKDIASCSQGRSSLVSLYTHSTSISSEMFEQDCRNDITELEDELSWKSSPPLLLCFRNLLRSIDLMDENASLSIKSVHAICLGSLFLCVGNKTLEGVKLVKFLFGIPCDVEDTEVAKKKLKDICDMISLLDQKIIEQDPPLYPGCQEIDFVQVRETLSSFNCHLQKSCNLDIQNEPCTSISLDALVTPSYLLFWKVNGHEDKSVDFSFGGIADTFVWECPDSIPEKLTASSLASKRKPASADGSSRRSRDNATGPETAPANTFSRGTGTMGTASGSSRRDTFRQRKPNTSRPPSMHVDDYVARERNIDGVSSSNVIGSGQRGGSASGRPPSIHVDEFMARQRERQNPTVVVVGETTQAPNVPAENGISSEKTDASQKLKTGLDDDLHELDIVFDAESESDDKSPFPHSDENLLTAPVMAGESPISIVEENDGDINEEPRSEVPSRPSKAQPEIQNMEGINFSSEKSLRRPEIKGAFPFGTSKAKENSLPRTPPGFPSTIYNVSASSPVQPVVDSRQSPSHFQISSTQMTPNSSTPMTSHGYYEQKIPASQPPLPPTPPPFLSSMPSKSADPGGNHPSAYVQHTRNSQPSLPSGQPLPPYDSSATSKLPAVHIPTENLLSTSISYMASMSANQSFTDNKQTWMASSLGIREIVSVGTSLRPPPPLPPTPPPFTSSSLAQSLMMNSSSQSFLSSQPPLPSSSLSDMRSVSFSTTNSPSFSPSPLASQFLLMRPTSATGTLLSSPTQPQNVPSVSPPLPSRPPPPPPPQGPRPPHLFQHLRPPLQHQQTQTDPMPSLQQNPIPIQLQPLQVPQQLQIPQIHVFYQAQQESLPPVPQPMDTAQASNMAVQTPDNADQTQQDSGLLLQQYFSSPEAIQSLLSDRDKLCQLLEQHPKLMQMLQERLGQL